MAAEPPGDFDSWVLLISQLEQSSPDDIGRISEAYDAFLLAFPLCYGYWKRYAEHKARLGSAEAAVEVYERGVEAAPYSVHLWDCYCGFAILVFEDADDVRRLFERGLSLVGKDYLCYLLWDKYLQFVYSQKQWNRLAHLYIRVLSFPTKKLDVYYNSFQKLVATMSEEGFAPEESWTKIGLDIEDLSASTVINPPDSQELLCVIDNLMNPMAGPMSEHALKMYQSAGQCFYQKARRIHADIICFENQIKRPYFHVKPIDDTQLDNWHRYLDFVLTQEDFDWTVKLHERCLIPCANYPEFWIRYVEYMERVGGREMADYTLVRATNVILKDIPEINIFSSRVKELRGDDSGARAAYYRCDSELDPSFVDNIKRKANMEKRLGNIEAATDVYKNALKILNRRCDIAIVSEVYVDFYRFTYTLKRDPDAARDVLIDGINNFPHCKVLLEVLMRFELMHGSTRSIDLIGSIISRALDSTESMSKKDRENISRAYLELVDQFGNIDDLNKAWTRHFKLFPHLLRRNCEDAVRSDSLIDIRNKGEENGGSTCHHVDHAPEGTNWEVPASEPPETQKYLPQHDCRNDTNEGVYVEGGNCEIVTNEFSAKSHESATFAEESKPSERQQVQDAQLPEVQKYLSQLEVENGKNDGVHDQEVNCELDMHESHPKVHELAEGMHSLAHVAELLGESKSPEQLQIPRDELPEVQTYLSQPEDQNGTNDSVYEQEDSCRSDMHESHVKVHELAHAICTISQAEVSKPPEQQQRQEDQLLDVQNCLLQLEVRTGANDIVLEHDDCGAIDVEVNGLAQAAGANEQQDQLPEVQNYLPQLEVQIGANDIVNAQDDDSYIERDESREKVCRLAQAVSPISQAGDNAAKSDLAKQQPMQQDQLPELHKYPPQLEAQCGTLEIVSKQDDNCKLGSEPTNQQQHGEKAHLPVDLEPPTNESLSVISEFDNNNISVATAPESQFSSGILASNMLTLPNSETESLIGMPSQNEISQACGSSREDRDESISQRKAELQSKVSRAINLLQTDKEQKIWEQIELLQKNQHEAVHRKNLREPPEGRPRQKRRTLKGSNMMWDKALNREPAQFRQQNYYQPSLNSFHPGYQMSSSQNFQLQDSSSSFQTPHGSLSFQFPPVTHMHAFSNQSSMPASGSYNLDQNAQEYNMQMWQYYQQQQQQYQMQLHHNQPPQILQNPQQQQQAEQSPISLPHLYYALQRQEHFMQQQQQSWVIQEQKQPSQSLIHPSQFLISGSYSQQAIPVQRHENSNNGLIGGSQLGVSEVSLDGINDGVSSLQHSDDHDHEQQNSVNN